MMNNVVSAETINKLNAFAIAFAKTNNIPDNELAKALHAAADEFGLTQVTAMTEGESSLIFHNGDGQYVNMWVDNVDQSIGHGGLGFDDQVDWYFDRVIE